jgi:alpha-tubulin suppressor-like RCC1 family protein
MTGPGTPRDTVFAWGQGSRGRLGLGNDTADRLRPVRVPGLSGRGITAVAAGGGHSLVLQGNRSMLVFGDNRKGQLGDGTKVESLEPKEIRADVLEQATLASIAAGLDHSLLVRGDGVTLAWGRNSRGQLGVNDVLDRDRPTKVAASNDVSANVKFTAVTAGLQHSVGLLDRPPGQGTGDLGVWGDNRRDQLGRRITNQDSADAPLGLAFQPISAVAAGFVHSAALQGDGTVLTWGDSTFGQLGDATTEQRSVDFVRPVPYLGGVVRVAAGAFHTLALMSNGRLLAWGANASGQLGDGTTTDRSVPVLVRDLGDADVVDIAAGMDFSVALLADKTVLTWGGNERGQLGDGTRNRRLTPVQVADEGASDGFLTGIEVIAAGSSHVLALR